VGTISKISDDIKALSLSLS